MEEQPFIIDSYLAKAARALVRISATNVSQRAGCTRKQLKAFENGHWDFDAQELRQLKGALEDLGAEFIDDDEDGGYGVRLKFSRSKAEVIERWEGEGGTAAEDDV